MFPQRCLASAAYNEFGKNRSLPPDSVEVQELVKKWQAYITDNYYNCTKEILSCLGQMYVLMNASRSTSTSMVSGRQLLWRQR